MAEFLLILPEEKYSLLNNMEVMKAIIEKKVEIIRNDNRRPGESNKDVFNINSRTVTIRLFGIPVYKNDVSFRD